jgi:restriction endonuclease Mrr
MARKVVSLWSAYEEHVTDLVRSEVADRLGDFFKLQREALYKGHSGVSHIVDLAVEFTIAGLRYLTVFEIKRVRGKLGASDLLEFIAAVEDLGASKAVVVSSGGFSEAAKQLARARGLALISVQENASRLEEGIELD